MKNIIFDLGGVILKGKSSDTLSKFFLNNKEIDLIKNIFFREDRFIELDLGYITMEDYFDKYSDELPNDFKVKVREVFLNYYKKRDLNLELIEIIKYLKEINKNIYILSNNPKEICNYLKTTELNNYVDGWIVSGNVNQLKPNYSIYKTLVNEFELNKEESIFVDDKEENIKAGLEVGIKGIVFKDDIETLNKIRNIS